MSGFEKQTYTQVPNSLFVTMKDMDECELKVVMLICRYTFGYHREEVKLSTRRIAEEIGMNTASVQKGADAAIQRGLIEKIIEGNKTTTWRAIVSVSENESQVIQNLNHDVSENESLSGLNKDKEKKTLEQRKAEAKERIAKQRAERAGRDPVLEQLKAAQDNAPLMEIRLRIENAMGLNLSREWDLPKSDWHGYDRTLLQREQETGETIEKFMEWYNADDFRRDGNIWLKPNKIEMFWRKAFSGNSKQNDVEELYPTL